MNSRRKGKVGELEFVQLLKNCGYKDAYRSAQHKGAKDSADVICESLGQFYFEVKRREQMNLHDVMEKAGEEAGEGVVPVCAHRKNGKPWLVTMNFMDWVEMNPVKIVGDMGDSKVKLIEARDCDHVWEEMEDGSRLCFECDEMINPKGKETKNGRK